MEQLTQLTEQLAAAMVLMDAEDLPSLAGVHGQLQVLGQAGRQMVAGPSAQAVCRLAQTGEKLVEQIILREVEDTAAAMEQLAQSVRQLQMLACGRDPEPLAAPVVLQKSAASAAPGSAEDKLKCEDLPLVGEFVSEARDHLEKAEACILQLEDDPENVETIGGIFRAFHTIKGVAGFLNLRQIGALAHGAESLLDLARKKQLTLDAPAVDLVLAAVDLMKTMVDAVRAAAQGDGQIDKEPRLAGMLDRLRAFADASRQSQPAASGPADTQDAPIARAAAAPTPPAAAPSAALPTQDSTNASDLAPAGATPQDIAQSPTAAQSSTPASEPASACSNAAANEPAAPSAGNTTNVPASASTNSPASASASASENSVKVSTERLDNLINTVGEMVIAQAMVSQDTAGLGGSNPRLARNLSHLGKITRQLQELSMSMRMVPIQGVFHKMSRLVRDLSRKADKRIELTITGGETELDRNVVEAINDPLVHMIRNSLDHGIETPEQRASAGKDPVGQVALKAYHQAGSIVIEIADDGRGLDQEKILAKARAAGIVGPDEQLCEQEIFKLIFHAGLSTAEKVTDISGRGVGMDVVKRNVDALRGRIDISSKVGTGTTICVRLPLTLAVIDGLVVRIGGHRYIVPLTSVEQSIQPKAQQLSTVQNRGQMCMVRDRLLPLFRLYEIFKVQPQHTDPTQCLVVIAQDNERRCCLMVDELLGQQQVVIKALGEGIGSIKGISGGAILGDGNVSLILDVPGLIDLASKQ